MRVCVRVFSVGFGPGLDSMSPARSRRSASHAAGTHGWLPQKTGRPGLRRGGVGGYNLHSVPPNCGTPTTSRLYPFGASFLHHPHYPMVQTYVLLFSYFIVQTIYIYSIFVFNRRRKSCLFNFNQH